MVIEFMARGVMVVMVNKEFTDTILNAYQNQLNYIQLDKHIILYNTDMIWDYNFENHRIRPFNSILWYDISSDIFKEFLFYIDEIIHRIINDHEFDNEKYPFITIDQSIKINLHILAFDLLLKSSRSEIRSFNQFFSFIRKLYMFNDLIIYKTSEYEKELFESLGELS